MKISGKLSVLSWDEKPQKEFGVASKITRATVTQSYAGEITGNSTIEYTMYYADSTHATFIGLEYFEGEIVGKSGSLVLEHRGTFEAGVAISQFFAIGGTDGLENFSCKGEFKTTSHCDAEYELIIER